ncbi:MAG: vancomycin resistance protein, partial [Chloroflexi bacterium HGW-Chloroflexi-7]
INQALQNGQHTVPLSFTFTNPPVTDQMTGAELGITELVTQYSTFFAGSSTDRVQNIKTASERFHGLLVPPGGTLSMSDMLGDISLDNGYAEALIILGDQTIKGVGGGVCQVSTTLFRTALYAGFQIVERHPHAYRVGYYEQINSSGSHDTDLAGLDATVFVPLVDFKFKNDTPYWLLMETYISTSNHSLTWKFYSTKDGREVSVNSSGTSNIVEPPEPVYRENPELPQGTKKQVDWEVEGADVTVTRTVTRNGEVLYNDSFFTRYEPWGDVWEYGPGTEIPTPTPSP